MIPFNYNFETKEVKNFLEDIKFIQLPWKKIPANFAEVAKLHVVNGAVAVVLPVSLLTEVTVFKFTVTNTAKVFVSIRAKVKGITCFAENFDNCQIHDEVLELCGPRF